MEITRIKTITLDFGDVCVNQSVTKEISIRNDFNKQLKYQVSYMYGLSIIDHPFTVKNYSEDVLPGRHFKIPVSFKPNVPDYPYVEYFLVDNGTDVISKLVTKGYSVGSSCRFDKSSLQYTIVAYKNVFDERQQTVDIINDSAFPARYQWMVPPCGMGQFRVCSDLSGTVRGGTRATAAVAFVGTAVGMFSAQLVCLIENQEPLILGVFATLMSPGTPLDKPLDHRSHKCRRDSSYQCYMENSLDFLPYVPLATMFDRFLDFGTAKVNDNVAVSACQTVCITNQQDQTANFVWMQDPEDIFIVEPVKANIAPKTSTQFSIQFRPNVYGRPYGHLFCGSFELEKEMKGASKVQQSWFRLPCAGNSWRACEYIIGEWECLTRIIMPPTSPNKIVFSNFALVNKSDAAMSYRFLTPDNPTFVMMPMCGVIHRQEHNIISVAFEPTQLGHYCENWQLSINKTDQERIVLFGSSEVSNVLLMSEGNQACPSQMLGFHATVTCTCSSLTSYLHNTSRLPVHVRVLYNADWLGADYGGSLVLQPNQIAPLRWWFYPDLSNRVYEANVTCTCVCLMDNTAVGEPTELFVNISGYSEHASMKALPKSVNLQEVVVDDTASFSFTLYNHGSCKTSVRLECEVDGLGDDHAGDEVELNPNLVTLIPNQHCVVEGRVTPRAAGVRWVAVRFRVRYLTDHHQPASLPLDKKVVCQICYDAVYPTLQVYRAIPVKCPVVLTGHCLWNIMNIDALNKVLQECRPNKPLPVTLYAPDLHEDCAEVEVALVVGCRELGARAGAEWAARRLQLCECEMEQVQVAINVFEMRHTCQHRALAVLEPMEGVVQPNDPQLLTLRFQYSLCGTTMLAFCLHLSHERQVQLRVSVTSVLGHKGVLTALRRPLGRDGYLATLDCGRVPINNLDPVVRIVWLYNPTTGFATWRLMRNSCHKQACIQCILYFAEVPPLSRLAIPVAFLPTEMVDYTEVLTCSFGFETVKILVTGQGGLPNCVETRLDVPRFVGSAVRALRRKCQVWLSHESLVLPPLRTHSLAREMIAITNDTTHVMRYVWKPERIANIINITVTPSWGVLHPKSTEWVSVTVFTLQEPATFTITVVCELLDLTERKRFHANENLRQVKLQQCADEFIITEEGTCHPDINDFPPYVLDLKLPTPFHLALAVAVSTQGHRDGVQRFCLKQLLEQTPMHDLPTAEEEDAYSVFEDARDPADMPVADVLRLIDCILWNALHSVGMKAQLEYYAKEEIPTSKQLKDTLKIGDQPRLSKRITSSICDAVVNQAISDVYSLEPKHHMEILRLL